MIYVQITHIHFTLPSIPLIGILKDVVACWERLSSSSNHIRLSYPSQVTRCLIFAQWASSLDLNCPTGAELATMTDHCNDQATFALNVCRLCLDSAVGYFSFHGCSFAQSDVAGDEVYYTMDNLNTSTISQRRHRWHIDCSSGVCGRSSYLRCLIKATRRIALHWTLLTRSWSARLKGPQSTFPYSK